MKKLTVRNEDVAQSRRIATNENVAVTHVHFVLVEVPKEEALFAKRREDCSITLWHPNLAIEGIDKIFQFYDPALVLDARAVEGEPFVYFHKTKLGEEAVIGHVATRKDMKDEEIFQVVGLKEHFSANMILGIIDDEIKVTDPLHLAVEPSEDGKYHTIKLDEDGKVDVSRCSKAHRHPKDFSGLPPGVSVKGFDSMDDLLKGIHEILTKQR